MNDYIVYVSTMNINTTNCKIVKLEKWRFRNWHLKYEIGDKKKESSLLRIMDYQIMPESGIVTLR